MKRIAWPVLIALWGASSSVQGINRDAVLAEGQPALTAQMVQDMIAFFEWTLNGKFSAQQRLQFQRDRIAEWQEQRNRDIATDAQIAATQAQLAALPAAQRDILKPGIQAALLKALREQPDNPTSRLLLAVYQTGQTLDRASGGPVHPNQAAGRVPAELVGEWGNSNTSMIDFVNPNTGAHAAPSGDHVSFRFTADGGYTEGGLIQSSLYNCTMRVFGYKTGAIAVEGVVMTIRETEYVLTSQDNCHAEWNYEKHPPLGTHRYQWRIEQDQNGDKLILTGTDNRPVAYYRVKPGQEVLQ